MVARKRLLGIRVTQMLLMALLVTQGVFVVGACALPASGVSMAYAGAGMPDDCTGLSKNACLMAYLQADQAPSSDGVAIGCFDGATIPVALPIAAMQYHLVTANRTRTPLPTAPPSHLLYCRMLR